MEKCEKVVRKVHTLRVFVNKGINSCKEQEEQIELDLSERFQGICREERTYMCCLVFEMHFCEILKHDENSFHNSILI